MIALFFATFGIAAVLGILQTNILQLFSMAGMFPIPDFSFIVLVYFAFTQGAMSGQLMGFASGILLDCLSLSPFGFNAFVRTACGHIIGRFKGVILLDNLLLPMAVVAAAQLIKAVMTVLTTVIIGQAYLLLRMFSLDSLFEFLLTIAFAPLIFLPLRMLRNFFLSRKAYH